LRVRGRSARSYFAAPVGSAGIRFSRTNVRCARSGVIFSSCPSANGNPIHTRTQALVTEERTFSVTVWRRGRETAAGESTAAAFWSGSEVFERGVGSLHCGFEVLLYPLPDFLALFPEFVL
jgi:hypothetical protein